MFGFKRFAKPKTPVPATPPRAIDFAQLFGEPQAGLLRADAGGRIKSYSQLGEDVFCFQNFMNIPRDDVVLFEVGAYDGLTYSNTYALEQYNNCKCVLVEPSPVNARKIYANRPKASVHNLAIMADFGVYEFAGDSPVSGVMSQLTEAYVQTWELKQSRRYNVMSAPFRAVMEVEKVAYIDFLSIDVQGAELLVLNSTNWDIPIGVICIELEAQHPADDEACRKLLREMGFRPKGRLHISEFWHKPDYARASLLFDPDRRVHSLDSFEHLYFAEGWRAGLGSNFY